jgi:Ca2+-binding RTX toxin-like protein
VGLSTSGDAVNLFDSHGALQANVSFGASPSSPLATFDNSAGLNNTTISQLSAVDVHGGTAATNDANEIGSPGTIVNPPGATIIGTNGADVIDATHTVAGQGLPSGLDDRINGRGGADSLSGLGGNDIINGGTGTDTMSGGTGDDRFHVDDAGDHVIELAGQGTDTVLASTSYTLEAGQEIERLRANAGSTGITLTGNELDNRIVGGDGDDIIAGGAGRDVLTGGAGHDTFVFTALTDSVVGVARDKIQDFVEGTDRIDLSRIDAISGTPGDDGFHFVDSGALSHAGDLRVYAADGNTVVAADVNGDHKADFQILIAGVHTLTASDFIL